MDKEDILERLDVLEKVLGEPSKDPAPLNRHMEYVLDTIQALPFDQQCGVIRSIIMINPDASHTDAYKAWARENLRRVEALVGYTPGRRN